MLYGEFLAGTQAADNTWTYSEYKRIEKVYNSDDRMTKEDAYKMYREPDEMTKELLDLAADRKAELIITRSELRAANEKAEQLQTEVREARLRILDLEREINRYREAAHNLYYATGTI